MWKNLSTSAQQVPATPEQNAAPSTGADDFYGTLDLGHEAQINNDLVRAIRTEIVEIENGLQVASNNVKNEERSFAQLTKNNNHSRGEMFHHRRDAAEVLDAETMTEDLRFGFKDQFAAEVAPHVVSPSSTNGHDDHDDAAAVSPEDESGGRRGPSASGPRAFYHKKFIDRKRAEAKEKAVSVHSIQQEIKLTRKKIKAMDEETASFIQDMNARQLDRVKMEGERQVEAKRREYEAESQRNRSVKEAVQVARANSGAYAQKIAEKAKQQMSESSTNKSKESTMASLNDAKQRELALLQDEEKQLDRELAALSGQLDFLMKQATEFEAEQKRSIDMKVEMEKVQRDIADLTSSKEEKAKEAEASNADLRSAVAAFEDASKAVAEANAEKLENDKATVEVLEPAMARKAEAVKEKERLAGEVVELQKSIEKAQIDSKEAVANSATQLATKSNELKDHQAKLDRARADFDELKKDDAAAQANLANELNEYKDFATKFEAATKAEVDRLNLLKNERTEARVVHLEKRRSDLGAIEDAQRKDVENLRSALAYVQEMKELKNKMDESEIVLDENGDEVQPKDGGEGDDRDDMVTEAAGSQ
mmetsp:Transcript_18946/g.39933  ORF Transcript_18946/g.39933 Transcript_18946/m.39933 type:complete len:594 (-) Transcript_18946:285-2066(-)|eukprot:CAMPEP_0183730278 /NCGR_PEP_ID=MMETSP0737-20130205/32442_1 /TAXON_ID=385413 /ORGANISM="Thalassiosira miniscula, Strain CCMP1093" /LENGTH=593 /DNA_ID=CAMNT_0025962731 /DNA_START=40 /DNA_END=1821 /DNA_ORIENTATION=-